MAKPLNLSLEGTLRWVIKCFYFINEEIDWLAGGPKPVCNTLGARPPQLIQGYNCYTFGEAL